MFDRKEHSIDYVESFSVCACLLCIRDVAYVFVPTRSVDRRGDLLYSPCGASAVKAHFKRVAFIQFVGLDALGSRILRVLAGVDPLVAFFICIPGVYPALIVAEFNSVHLSGSVVKGYLYGIRAAVAASFILPALGDCMLVDKRPEYHLEFRIIECELAVAIQHLDQYRDRCPELFTDQLLITDQQVDPVVE